MKVLKISAVIGDKPWTAVFAKPCEPFSRVCIGLGKYNQQAFPSSIARVNMDTGPSGGAVVTMFAPARIGTQLLASQDTFGVQAGEPVVAVIGNIDFTFEIIEA